MRLRFTIRDLLWVTLVTAIVLGWSVSRIRTQKCLNDQIKLRQQAEGDYQRLRAENDFLREQMNHRDNGIIVFPNF